MAHRKTRALISSSLPPGSCIKPIISQVCSTHRTARVGTASPTRARRNLQETYSVFHEAKSISTDTKSQGGSKEKEKAVREVKAEGESTWRAESHLNDRVEGECVQVALDVRHSEHLNERCHRYPNLSALHLRLHQSSSGHYIGRETFRL